MRIQKVFEDESTVHQKASNEMTKEEEVEFYERKKKKILGSNNVLSN